MRLANQIVTIAAILATTMNLAFTDDDLRTYWYVETKDPEDTSQDWQIFLDNEPNRTNPINPIDFCTGIQCQLSALNVEQKGRIYNKINQFRQEFVYGKKSWKLQKVNTLSDSFANIFLATWDEEIAEYAQQKAALCLNIKFDINHVHKGPLQSHWNRFPDRYPTNSECQVQTIRYFSKIEDYASNRSIIPKEFVFSYLSSTHQFKKKSIKRSIARSVISYAFGCGMVVRKDEENFIEQFVCYYCPAVTIEHFHQYLPRNGTPCSKCKGYFGLRDIQCTTDIDPKLSKLLGLKFDGLCFSGVIPTDKFVSTLYPIKDCPYGYPTTPIPIPKTRTTKTITPTITTMLITPNNVTIATSTEEPAPVTVPKTPLTCFISVHVLFVTLIVLHLAFKYFLNQNNLERDAESYEEDNKYYDNYEDEEF